MNKVFNNDNARRYVHMALSRQIKSMEAANSSSGETTTDDVVKFLHDAYATEDWLPFPYETAAEIPSLDDAIQAGLPVGVNTVCKTTTAEEYSQAMDMMNDKMVLLFTPTFSIWAIQGMKMG